jgi:hypothetical protein
MLKIIQIKKFGSALFEHFSSLFYANNGHTFTAIQALKDNILGKMAMIVAIWQPLILSG